MSREHLILKEMKELAKCLGDELEYCGLKELSNEVREFRYNYYTTSSEYLGEFRIVLKKVLSHTKDKLSNKWIDNINIAIEMINKAFSN